MGLLRSALRIMHPVRTVKRSVKRAIIPRPVRRVMYAKNVVVHPVSTAKGSLIGAIDDAITPKRRRTLGKSPFVDLHRRTDNQAKMQAQPQFSQDGKWWWNGSQWLPVPQAEVARTSPIEQRVKKYYSQGQFQRDAKRMARQGWRMIGSPSYYRSWLSLLYLGRTRRISATYER